MSFDAPDEVLEIDIQSGPITFTQNFQLLDIIEVDRTARVDRIFTNIRTVRV